MVKPSYEELEHKVKSLENQLRQRQRMDSLGTLAQGVAHDFNNILSGIMAYLNILTLTSDNFSVSQKNYIKNIVNAVKRGAATIRQFQKLSARTISVKADIDIFTVAREVFYMLEETTDKIIEKKLDIERNSFFIHADINEIHQVFMNLGMNAVHAIEEKGAQKGDCIRLSVDAVPVNGSDISPIDPVAQGMFYRIRFEDTGCGIPKKLLGKIFDPLFTTKNTIDNKGQGLGLAMVQDIIIKRHGGHIKVSSIVGQSTVFDLFLPKANKALSDSLPHLGIQGGCETILVVDDDDAVRESIKTALEDFGYEVLPARDGEEGLKLFKDFNKQIDAVLLDIIMPEMSGRQLFRQMLKIDPHVKVIISSGHSQDQYNDDILKRAKNYLNKPFELDVLETTLRQVLDD